MPDRGFRIDRPIALVGLMGAGKSSIGRQLAERLGLPFADSDLEVEQLEGMSIVETFDQFGESYFRERERLAIFRLLDMPPRVIATGGGAFADPATHRALQARSVTIWLDAPVQVLAERVAGVERRPLLRDGGAAPVLEALLSRRLPCYAKAHMRVETGDVTAAQAADRIVAALSQRPQ